MYRISFIGLLFSFMGNAMNTDSQLLPPGTNIWNYLTKDKPLPSDPFGQTSAWHKGVIVTHLIATKERKKDTRELKSRPPFPLLNAKKIVLATEARRKKHNIR